MSVRCIISHPICSCSLRQAQAAHASCHTRPPQAWPYDVKDNERQQTARHLAGEEWHFGTCKEAFSRHSAALCYKTSGSTVTKWHFGTCKEPLDRHRVALWLTQRATFAATWQHYPQSVALFSTSPSMRHESTCVEKRRRVVGRNAGGITFFSSQQCRIIK